MSNSFEGEKVSLIYEVQVTKENVPEMLTKEVYRLIEAYGPNVRQHIAALAIGPNSLKAFELWAVENCLYRTGWENGEMTFMDFRIVGSSLPFVVPLFTRNGWHIAHQEAKRMTELLGVGDA